MRWRVALSFSILACLLMASSAHAQFYEEEKFSLNGYFQAQYGMFTNTAYHNETDKQGFPSDHGDMAGMPSIARHTLLLEGDWRPTESIRLHVVFRGVRSAELRADRFAQVLDIVADTKYNYDPDVEQAKISAVQDRYYNEQDFRELYLDINPHPRVNLRLGRQQVSWGDMGNLRLLDVINPVDSNWHLAPFESFEDTRVPLYLAKLLVDIPEVQGSIELVYVPLLDDPEDTVNAPLTAVGAWGLPLASQNDYVSDLRIRNKIINYPGQDLKDFRWGGRWKGVLGGLTYTLVAYHGHQLSPPVPDYVIKEGTPDPDGYTPADVYLRVPRLDVFGFSLDYAFESPIGAVVKFEAAVEPNRQYGVNSFLSAGFSPDNRDTNPWTILDPTAAPGQSPLKADLHYEERHTLNYALEIFRANQWRFINNTSSTITVFRLMQNFYFNPDDINDNKFKLGNPYVREIFADGSSALNENWHIVYAPGYDTTIPANMDTILVWAMFTSYFHGAFTPGVTAIYKPRHVLMIEDASDVFDWEAFEEGSGFVATSFKFAFGNHWRPEVGFNYIFGQDPYYDLGLYRDRDEVYAKVKYQF